MHDIFARVDDALIDRVFQPFVDWADHHLALGINRAARLCIDLASLAWILAEAGRMAGAIGTSDFKLAAFRGITVVMGLCALTVLRNIFQRTDGSDKRREGGQPNPLRAGMHVHRATCLFWTAGLLIKTAETSVGFEPSALLAMGLFATASVYIGACTTYPPKRREIRSSEFSQNLVLGTSRS